jgi:glycosyltransferase involved in cell wall biosynthesis
MTSAPAADIDGSRSVTPSPVSATVVVLTYNNARTIDCCLRSIATQSRPPVEVLVVDDDSTDTTLSVVVKVAREEQLPVRVLRNGAHNISRGRNIGLSCASTEIVLFLDSDAVADPHWIEQIIRCFDGPDAPAVVGGEVVPAHATAFAEALTVNDLTVRELFANGRLLVQGCNMAVHRERSGGVLFAEDWTHAEDIEYLNRACRHFPWLLAQDAIVHHESRPTPRAYLRQMYRYGFWKVRYTAATGDVRLVDYVPTVLTVLSVLIAPWVLWALLALPILCVVETFFVATYRRPSVRLLPMLLAGWIIKNVGWGAGVAVGLLSTVVQWRRVAGRA